MEGQFTFDDFLDQMQQLKKMGPLKGVLGMMPGVPKEVRNAEIDDREIGRIEAIIRSMTTAERVEPDLIDQSRRVRIARGSGTDPTQVAELVKQFKEVSKMMKRMGGMGTKRIAKSRRKAAKSKGKGKGPGGRTTGGGRVAPKGKPPLKLPDFGAAGLGGPGLPNLGGTGPNGLPDFGLGEGFPER
jgi:signal recognition particle subunit SRP54